MDEMRIVSKFTRDIISRLASRALYKRFGCGVDIQLNEVKASVADGKTHVHLDIDAELGKDELMNVLKTINLV